ncbi:MAG: DUF4125 family protein [Coriobacteriaceae bacterium]|uniref:DUF4125 family protein n=1 Tax=Tractidigestivibacter sp. TaxID=2847320 RepID=UPI002A7FE50F|nr:DUF4125 family protein [Tractidigestivibacter sp.]MCI6274824.1 DUF4125 family protein [Coriobacteriaceae bacterium]MCI6547275.1 DUF4125 family protein [Coriobacteriaceae bacterium]MCI6844376.1 DUF4125 family protein [Coriobacteriaceae bacterium]MCI7438535.1 DUF4125 family protein [Coriobacteriaceae bacterium]MDD7583255.1 DUF4125 family protein [Coriobacteriaceae bacterium]
MSVSELVETVLGREDEDFERALQEPNPPCDATSLGLVLNRFRAAGLALWPESLLEAYLQDLENARACEKSMVLERAAYLFGTPYRPDAHRMLPPKSYEFCERVGLISKLSLIWEVRAREIVPRLTSRLGALISEEDRPGEPSYESRLRAELMSYSQRTIDEYGSWVFGCWGAGRNPNMQAYDGAAIELGFSGAYEANYKGAVL